jgi:hypothetical protein
MKALSLVQHLVVGTVRQLIVADQVGQGEVAPHQKPLVERLRGVLAATESAYLADLCVFDPREHPREYHLIGKAVELAVVLYFLVSMHPRCCYVVANSVANQDARTSI